MIEKRKGGGHDLSCDGCGVSEEVPGSWEDLMAHGARLRRHSLTLGRGAIRRPSTKSQEDS